MLKKLMIILHLLEIEEKKKKKKQMKKKTIFMELNHIFIILDFKVLKNKIMKKLLSL